MVLPRFAPTHIHSSFSWDMCLWVDCLQHKSAQSRSDLSRGNDSQVDCDVMSLCTMLSVALDFPGWFSLPAYELLPLDWQSQGVATPKHTKRIKPGSIVALLFQNFMDYVFLVLHRVTCFLCQALEGYDLLTMLKISYKLGLNHSETFLMLSKWSWKFLCILKSFALQVLNDVPHTLYSHTYPPEGCSNIFGINLRVFEELFATQYVFMHQSSNAYEKWHSAELSFTLWITAIFCSFNCK